MEPIEIASDIAKKLETAWNNAIGSEFQKSYTEITDFVDITGTHHKAAPKEAIGAGHQAILDTIYKDSKVKYTVTQANKIDANTIIAHISGTIEIPSGPMAGNKNAMITMVLVPENNEWKIRAFHNTLVTPRENMRLKYWDKIIYGNHLPQIKSGRK